MKAKDASKPAPVLHGVKAVTSLRKAAKRAQKHTTGDNFFDGPDGLDEKGHVRPNHCYRRDEYALLLRTSFELEKARERHIQRQATTTKKESDDEDSNDKDKEEGDAHHDAVAGSHARQLFALFSD